MDTQIVSEETSVAGDKRSPQAGSATNPAGSGASGMAVSTWRKCVARLAVFLILVGVACVVYLSPLFRVIFGLRRRERLAADRRLLLTGTFYNVGWFRSHITPLSLCDRLDHVYVVADQPLFPIAKVTYCVPPGWLSRLVGRTPSRMIWVFRTAMRVRSGFVMGYHIMPNALMSLAVAKLLGAKSVYQMTGGPVQIIGGGVGSENVLLRQLGKPSRLREALLYHLVRRFDQVIVRGEGASAFVRQNRLNEHCSIITGSVNVERFCPNGASRDIDIVYVSRLVPCKGLEAFLHIVAEVVKKRPALRVAILGDGPLRPDLERTAAVLEIETNIEFRGRVERVEQVLQRCRLFVLVSPSEGMSIAMMEAMATGVPVMVTDVGDLRDLVTPNLTGLLLHSAEPKKAAAEVVRILRDDHLWSAVSAAARTMITQRCRSQAIAQRWDQILGCGPTA